MRGVTVPGTVSLTVYGTPVPKGSARAFAIPGKGGARPRAVVVSDNKKSLTHWQTQVANEARLAIKTLMAGESVPEYHGAMQVTVEFAFNRPRSVKPAERPFPSVKPDIDKLARAVLDGLTGVLWNDDAQVVGLQLVKRYLPEPGSEFALITVRGLK